MNRFCHEKVECTSSTAEDAMHNMHSILLREMNSLNYPNFKYTGAM